MQEDLHCETGEEKMKCPICMKELIPINSQEINRDLQCSHTRQDYIKEIERLKSLIKRFMKAQGKPVRVWMLGHSELLRELLLEVKP